MIDRWLIVPQTGLQNLAQSRSDLPGLLPVATRLAPLHRHN